MFGKSMDLRGFGMIWRGFGGGLYGSLGAVGWVSVWAVGWVECIGQCGVYEV